jgi:hypothetical protein
MIANPTTAQAQSVDVQNAEAFCIRHRPSGDAELLFGFAIAAIGEGK